MNELDVSVVCSSLCQNLDLYRVLEDKSTLLYS